MRAVSSARLSAIQNPLAVKMEVVAATSGTCEVARGSDRVKSGGRGGTEEFVLCYGVHSADIAGTSIRRISPIMFRRTLMMATCGCSACRAGAADPETSMAAEEECCAQRLTIFELYLKLTIHFLGRAV